MNLIRAQFALIVFTIYRKSIEQTQQLFSYCLIAIMSWPNFDDLVFLKIAIVLDAIFPNSVSEILSSESFLCNEMSWPFWLSNFLAH